jgi:DNA-binding PadR family transcriptional regulator
MPKKRLDPLPSTAFHILLALADEDRHGYAIMRQVAEETGGRVRLGPGTLYGSIKTLLDAGLIEECGERVDSGAGDERRRYYRLTGSGRNVARAEAERMADLVRLAEAKSILRGAHV